jgi:nitroreductase
MTFEQLIVKNRSYRRFDHSRPIAVETLRQLVDIARRTPSAANRQPLKYGLIAGEAACALLFPFTRWGGSLKGWGGPTAAEQPVAYIVVLADHAISKDPVASVDCGIACQSMLLAAVERGLGGCMLGAIDRDGIRRTFTIPDTMEVLLVVALGVPAETCVLEDAPSGGSITYYRTPDDVHHVPKRPMEDIIVDL